MKQLTTKIIVLLALAAAAMACSKSGGEEEAYGTLRFGEIEVTRAAETDNYAVTIYAADGQTVEEWLYGELPAEVTLKVGEYRIGIVSGEMPDAEWESPVYSVEKEFSIEENRTTELGTLTMKLANLKVSVTYAPELAAALGEDCSVTVRMGGSSLEFVGQEERAGYFKVPESGNSLQVEFAGTVDGVEETLSATIDNVKAGEWRKINISMSFVVEEDGRTGVTIGEWVSDPEVVPGE